jgi:hypothetical protein
VKTVNVKRAIALVGPRLSATRSEVSTFLEVPPEWIEAAIFFHVLTLPRRQANQFASLDEVRLEYIRAAAVAEIISVVY